MGNTNALVFNDIRFDVIDRDGQPWIQSGQLASALGYKDEGSVRKIYARNSDEFTPAMSVTVNLTRTGGIPTETRIFSLRGCHLLAMFARTAVAKAFRVWVLDVLETLNGAQRREQPTLDTTTRLSTSADQCRKNLESLKRVWVSMAPIGYGEASKMIAATLGVGGVDDMTIAQVEQACVWVQLKIDTLIQGQNALAPAPAPAPGPDPTQSMVMDSVVRLRKLAYDYSTISERLFGMFVKDNVVQSLHLSTALSMQALANHYADIIKRA